MSITKETRGCMKPQAVPRGFLRMYILSKISRERQSGYSIMKSIVQKTDGTWRPGPGTIYPLLKRLAREGLTRPIDSEGSVLYTLTEKGDLELDKMRTSLIKRGNDEVMMNLASDLFPVSFFVSHFHRHYRALFNLFAEKISEARPSEREFALKEMVGTLQKQLTWVRSSLDEKRGKKVPFVIDNERELAPFLDAPNSDTSKKPRRN